MTATGKKRRTLRIDDPVGPGGVAANDRTSGSAANGRLRDLPIAEIHPNPEQPRKRFDEESLAALADSVRERGVIQPVIVRPRSGGGGYELVAGERRWRAANLAALASVPALVDEQLDGAASVKVALIENMAREDLSPIEEARTIATLLDDLNITATALAARLGRSHTDIAHTVRLLELPDEAIELVDAGVLSKGHGKALRTEPDHHRRRVLARRAADHGWSVRTLEAEIANCGSARRTPAGPPADQAAAAARLEDALTRATGCEVRARPHRQGYQIIVDHHAAQRLAQLLAVNEGAA
jgi:ParB family transcriptional regulator, chromosome partitioning protein